MQAIGGRRRAELRERYARFTPKEIRSAPGVETICRHHRGYPRALASRASRAERRRATARRDAVRGGRSAAAASAARPQPTVAIVGSRRATDYGMEMARSLARGLAASGVTVTAGLSDGIAVAAQAGALEAEGETLTVMDGGLDVACPARRRALYGAR